ncbi:VOC family protein [Niveispirillum fermenti]|uniref:2-oxoadipate dioxygenase/decarboxylase HglS n=1 Tax=Niveispirillum fermenti TaxID=1233113 RepID=UPI003A85A78E
MTRTDCVPPDEIRALFSIALSDMYRTEVPQYGALLELVASVNADALASAPDLMARLECRGELARLDVERHGAIRVGTAAELFDMRRLFAVMGMVPVGYYDLSVAGVPVHSTAFRPVGAADLRRNPFRVFTSLLRLDLIGDEALRAEAAAILSARRIFTPRAMELVAVSETQGGLDHDQAAGFVREALETFRWHAQANVGLSTYKALVAAHRLVADIVSFKGPHINHLTPRTLDIDAAQARMVAQGMAAKAQIEGPPRRDCPILLRQTSFKALSEPVGFATGQGDVLGTHTARFGEIEQRGAALTPKGRLLYDQLLAAARRDAQAGSGDDGQALAMRFRAFPDDWRMLRDQGLAFFRYFPTPAGLAAPEDRMSVLSVDDLVDRGYLGYEPITYEDFLPVSAAGIFQSNLGAGERRQYDERSSRASFEQALGAPVRDEMVLYADEQSLSIRTALARLGLDPDLPLKAEA